MFANVRAAVFLLCLAPGLLMAADAPEPSAPPPAGDELKALREMLETQSRQLDVLAQEIARLNLLLEGKSTGSIPAPVPAGSAGAMPAGHHDAPAPRATAVSEPATTPGGPTHVVTKGETLTSIAHHYKVTVAEILKFNKIGDVRRLQIGQTVNLPPGAAAAQESASPPLPATPTPQPQ